MIANNNQSLHHINIQLIKIVRIMLYFVKKIIEKMGIKQEQNELVDLNELLHFVHVYIAWPCAISIFFPVTRR